MQRSIAFKKWEEDLQAVTGHEIRQHWTRSKAARESSVWISKILSEIEWWKTNAWKKWKTDKGCNRKTEKSIMARQFVTMLKEKLQPLKRRIKNSAMRIWGSVARVWHMQLGLSGIKNLAINPKRRKRLCRPGNNFGYICFKNILPKYCVFMLKAN